MKELRIYFSLIASIATYVALCYISRHPPAFPEGTQEYNLTYWPLIISLFALSVASSFISYELRQRLSSPPGWGLRRFAEAFFSKKTFTQVLEPTLSDMQKEHFDALAAGRLWQARMALVRGYWSFWSAALAQLPISFARRVYEIWKTTKTGS